MARSDAAAGGDVGEIAFGGGMALARFIGGTLQLAPAVARFGLGSIGGGHFLLGLGHDLALGFGMRTRGIELSLDFCQAIAFGEAARRAGGGIGCDCKSVPAPQIALARHQPLAGLQQRHEAIGLGPFHEPDLAQAAIQFGH